MIGEQTLQGRSENLSQANKLSRTYSTLLEALNRHRGKGQQKVTVEHVHVHAGGQAVVGSVETQGGGDKIKSEDQPHARQIADFRHKALSSGSSRAFFVASRSDIPSACHPSVFVACKEPKCWTIAFGYMRPPAVRRW